MTDIEFFYDPISPYAHLAFAALPRALMGHSVVLHYRPVLFAGLLKAHGQLGPAEIPAKRDWTYRQIQWLAHTHGIRLDLPAAPCCAWAWPAPPPRRPARPAATSPSCCSSTCGTAAPTRPNPHA
jgi:hypothetical protein